MNQNLLIRRKLSEIAINNSRFCSYQEKYSILVNSAGYRKKVGRISGQFIIWCNPTIVHNFFGILYVLVFLTVYPVIMDIINSKTITNLLVNNRDLRERDYLRLMHKQICKILILLCMVLE